MFNTLMLKIKPLDESLIQLYGIIKFNAQATLG